MSRADYARSRMKKKAEQAAAASQGAPGMPTGLKPVDRPLTLAERQANLSWLNKCLIEGDQATCQGGASAGLVMPKGCYEQAQKMSSDPAAQAEMMKIMGPCMLGMMSQDKATIKSGCSPVRDSIVKMCPDAFPAKVGGSNMVYWLVGGVAAWIIYKKVAR